ncbi:MAG: hypothetical protein ACYSTL_00495 [Planctomycetota bacterium]|jgi:hypothetical protein
MGTSMMRRIVSVGLILGFLAIGYTSAGEMELAPRYVDSLNGFSLRPPAGTDRTREFSPKKLVSWSFRNPKSGAVVWMLGIHRVIEDKKEIDLKEYSRVLTERLLREQKLHAESVKLITVAGKDTIDLCGETEKIDLYQRQVWVLTGPGQFLVVIIAGPVSMKDDLNAISGRVLNTLELTDPTDAREALRKNLLRGEQFLKAFDGKKLHAAITPESQWFLLRLKGKEAGFHRVVESKAKRENVEGYEVRTYIFLAPPDEEPRVMKQMMFVTPDLVMERWTKHLRISASEATRVISEDGLKQHEIIVCNIREDGRTTTRKKLVPVNVYLPHAVGELLPRLIDLSKPAAYTFAEYNAQKNDFEQRTVAVIGEKVTTLSGNKVRAIRMEDRPTADTPASVLHLDSKGRLLLMRTADGLEMERSSASVIALLFPNASTIDDEQVK